MTHPGVKAGFSGRALAWGDAACIVLFAVVGLLSHREALSWAGIARNALPILLIWFLLAPFLRTYTYPSWRNLLYNWGLAVVGGVWLRFMVLGHPFGAGFFVFCGITLAFTLLFLLLWRALAYFVVRQRRSV